MDGIKQCCDGIILLDQWVSAPFTLPVLITFVVYLGFFAANGLRRGALRELIVLLVALIGWIVLQEQGDIFVRVANLGAKFTAFVEAGGLTENQDEAFKALSDAPSWVTDSTRYGYLFLLWIAVVLFTYFVTNRLIPDKKSESNGWAILLGIANGLFLASVFLPRLVVLFAPEVLYYTPETAVTGDGRASIASFLRNGVFLISQAISHVWALFEPIRPLALLILLTAFLVFVYWTIKAPKFKWWNKSSSQSG